MDEKKPLSRAGRKKRNQRYMIYLVSGIMIFSGLYIGLNNTNTAPAAPRTDYSSRIRQYQVYPIGNRSVPVRIDNESTDLILMFKQAGTLSADTVESILSEDTGGVNSSTFEVSGAFNFFRFHSTPFVVKPVNTASSAVLMPGEAMMARRIFSLVFSLVLFVVAPLPIGPMPARNVTTTHPCFSSNIGGSIP